MEWKKKSNLILYSLDVTAPFVLGEFDLIFVFLSNILVWIFVVNLTCENKFFQLWNCYIGPNGGKIQAKELFLGLI